MKPLTTSMITACCWVLLLIQAGCAASEPAAETGTDVARGQYLVNLLGCGRCHTEGYLTGNQARGPYLAGSRIGMAYTAYSMDETNPGVVFPSNLTGDPETGLGSWSIEDITTAMTQGITRDGHERLMIMPWVNYNAITRADLLAIAGYLKSLGPVKRAIPEPVPEGEPSHYPYVRYGVYEFSPHQGAEKPSGVSSR